MSVSLAENLALGIVANTTSFETAGIAPHYVVNCCAMAFTRLVVKLTTADNNLIRCAG